MFFALRTPQERESLMNERIQTLEIPGALLIERRPAAV